VKIRQIKSKVLIIFCILLISITFPISTKTAKAVENKKLPTLLCIDTPQNNAKVKGNKINVGGWSLNVSGVKQVQVAVDNGKIQNTAIGQARPDVAKVYPGYTGGEKVAITIL
jgi:hypothetical protein